MSHELFLINSCSVTYLSMVWLKVGFCGGFADNQLLGDYLLVNLCVAFDALEQELTGCNPHEVRLVLNGRHAGGDIGGMGIVRETYQGYVLGNA